MDDSIYLYAILTGIGIVTGTLTGLTGASGMSVLISGLLLAGFDIRRVIGLTFVVTLANSAAAVGVYWRHGHVDLRTTALIALPAVFAVMIGHGFSGYVAPGVLTAVMVCCLLALGIKFVSAPRDVGAEDELRKLSPDVHANSRILIVMGCLIGLIMGMLGGGGAVFISAGLILLVHFPAKSAIGTSVAIMGLAAIPGAALHWNSGTIRFDHAAVILLVSMPIAFLAGRFANRVSDFAIKRLLGYWLVTISLFLLGRLVLS